ncbi:MAG: hypothetical protein WC558_09760 [Patulibacter sp.]
MSTVTVRRPLHLALIPGVLAGVLALSACGGGDDATTTNADASAGSGAATEQRANGRANMEELQACLQKQGVELPERPAGQNGERPAPPEGGLPGGGPPPGQGGEGGPGGDLSAEDREKLQKAMEECGGGRGGPGGPGEGRQRPDVNSAEYQKSINAYVSCVRENGYDLPDPDFSGDGPIFDAKKVDQQDATFKKASAACQSELRQP